MELKSSSQFSGILANLYSKCMHLEGLLHFLKTNPQVAPLATYHQGLEDHKANKSSM